MSLDIAKPTVGPYELVQKIAEGGMGTVYKAQHRTSGQIVAIKVVPPHLMKNQVLMKRFEQEYIAAKAIDHANIVRAIEYGVEDCSPYLVMEYVDGESLGQKLEHMRRIPEADAVRIIAQVAQGLHKAHKMGLVHRDVKPDNILINAEGQAKLTDLGLVKELDTDLNLTRTGRGLGTPHFMAPEQFRNAKNADLRCDIYSLAATLYQMVTGELPFKGCGPLDAWMKKIHNDLAPPRQIVPTLSERVDWAIRRAMSPDPNQRPADCREFIEDLTGHSTRRLPPTSGDTYSELWYLIYRDELGMDHTVKGSKAAIRRSLKEGLLGDASNVKVSRTKTGVYDLLKNFPEFRDLVVLPGTLPSPQTKTPSPSRTLRLPSEETKTQPKIKSRPELPKPPSIAMHDSPQPVFHADADMVKWTILILVAAGSALAGYFVLPWLTGIVLH
jgi:serine/threonine protein kinase